MARDTNTRDIRSKKRSYRSAHFESDSIYNNIFHEVLLISQSKNYRKLILLIVYVYMLIIMVFFLIRDNSFSSLFSLKSEPDTSKVEVQVETLKLKLIDLENSIKTASNTSDTQSVNIRINQLEEGQKNIADSIDLDINKALTARLLQEKQKTIEGEISLLHDSQNDLDKRIDGLVTTLVAIPLGGFILTLASAFIFYLVSKKTDRPKD